MSLYFIFSFLWWEINRNICDKTTNNKQRREKYEHHFCVQFPVLQKW